MQVWAQGIFLTLFGMGVTYLCLIALDLLIRGLDRLFREPLGREAPAPSKGPRPGKTSPPNEDISPVIAAAVAAYLEAQAVEVFRVPVRREASSRWVADGRQTALSRRDSV